MGEKTHNKYSQNAKELYRLIEEFFSNKDEYDSIPKDTLNKLSNFITKNIQFIVIETHANLSKTLKFLIQSTQQGLILELLTCSKSVFTITGHISAEMMMIFSIESQKFINP